MAEKQHHSEKDMKNYYKSEISRLEKELKEKDRTIYDLRCNIKSLENRMKNKKPKKKVVPVDKREAARLKAIEAKEAAKKAREGKC